MKKENNALQKCHIHVDEIQRTPYENLINSLKHAYDQMPTWSSDKKDSPQRTEATVGLAT